MAFEMAEEIGIHPITLPTGFAVGPVNSYLIEDDPLTLVDAGPNSATTFEALEAGASGAFTATYIAYPTLYGPRQPGSPEWSIVRRLRDRRPRIVIPDGGLRIESRGYVRNVARAPLAAVDHLATAAGRSYVVADREVYTVRQRVEFIARHMGVEVELVDMPYQFATLAHPLYRGGPSHRATRSDAIRHELGYSDVFDTATALAQTVDWLLAASEVEIDEIESQLGDSFGYGFEDALITWWQEATSAPPQPADGEYTYSHIYRHPSKPGESWGRV